MKKIEYQNGLVAFSIPKNWIEEYSDEHGAAFYEDSPNSGTLRLNVMTVSSDSENGNPSVIFKEQKNIADLKEYLSTDGDEICEYILSANENNTLITITTFACIHQTKQNDFLIAIFTWTIESLFENQDAFKEELNSIRNNILQIKFGL
jgi:hypothetical protein